MTERTDSPEAVDVGDVANTVVDRFRSENDAADVSLVYPDEVLITSHRAVLRRVLSELVKKSLERTNTDSPRVEVSVRETSEGTVEISVADDGPGLPEREREILASGTETQLEHGHGIGVWFVNWAVTQSGGDLEFRETEPEGSVVTVRLYRFVG